MVLNMKESGAYNLDRDTEEDIKYGVMEVSMKDIGKIIGKQGRTVQAIKTILAAASAKIRKRSSLEIIE